MAKKTKKIIGVTFLIVFVLGLCLAAGFAKHHFSVAQTEERYWQAIQKKDWLTFKKISPRYTNKKPIKKAQFLLFAKAWHQKSQKKFHKLVQAKESYQISNRNKWFHAKRFAPKARMIVLTSDDAKLSLEVEGQRELGTQKKVGPLLPASYATTLYATSDAFGKTQKKQQVGLQTQNQTLDYTASTEALKDAAFQKNLLQLIVNFYVSFNDSVNKDFDFSGLKGVTADYQTAFEYTMKNMQPYLSSYQQTVQNFAMNVTSLKFEDSVKKRLIFDVYVDRSVKMQLDKKYANSEQEYLTDSKNATVTLLFDTAEKRWVIEEIDFETYAENPADWTSKRSQKLAQPSVGKWEKGASKSDNSI